MEYILITFTPLSSFVDLLLPLNTEEEGAKDVKSRERGRSANLSGAHVSISAISLGLGRPGRFNDFGSLPVQTLVLWYRSMFLFLSFPLLSFAVWIRR